MNKPVSKKIDNLTREIESLKKTNQINQQEGQKLGESEQYLETIIESIPVPLFVKNNLGQYIMCNKAFERFIENPREKILGKTIFDLEKSELADKINRSDMNVIQAGKSNISEETRRKSDGSIINTIIHKNVFHDKQNNTTGIIGTVVDITEIKRAEKLLKIQHTIDYLTSLKKGLIFTLKNILDQIMELEWVDAGGIYLYNNEKEELKLVYSSGVSEQFAKSVEVYNKNSVQYKLIKAKKAVYGNYPEIAKKSKSLTREKNLKFVAVIPLIITENDELVGGLNLASKKYDKITNKEKSDLEYIAQSLVGLIVYARSQEKVKKLNSQIEQALKEQQNRNQFLIQKSKLESLGELAAGIAHEINQPLGVMALSLENLQMKLASKKATSAYLHDKFNSIEGNINRIRTIIDHIRTFSRDQESIAIEKINLSNVVNKAMSLIGAQYRNHNIHIRLDLKNNIGFSVGSNIQVEQMVLNLLSNAKYAVEDRAAFKDETDFRKEIIIRTDCTDKKIILMIEDNGTGIDEIHLPNIFDPFFTTKPEGFGTGLGLSIAYGIVQNMRGYIQVDSKKNEFTKFTILLPRFPEKD